MSEARLTRHQEARPASCAIAIIDPYCLTACTSDALESSSAGQTEAAVLKVARALSGNFRFHFYQNGRLDPERDSVGFYRPLEALNRADLTGVSAIVVINSWKTALKARKLHPACPIILWAHGLPGRHNRRMGEALADAGIEIICVTRAHAEHVTTFLQPENRRLPTISWIYSPVDNELTADGTRRDPDLLFHPGMPLKGMPEILAKFDALRARRPHLRLEIAEPASPAWPAEQIPEGVRFIGRLPRTALIDKMRCALCLFHPQTRANDPFSLLLAEANAVGTPVLAHHGIGANDEITGASGQVLDTDDLDAVVTRLDMWGLAPPMIDIPAAFRLHQVAAAWNEKLLTKTRENPVPPGGVPNGLEALPAAAPDT